MKRILISVTPEEISMALVCNERLLEYILERNNEERIVGSIFKGKVKNLAKGIEAAFIDIGREKNAFFYNSAGIDITMGQNIVVQIIKDAMGSKGPRASLQISLPGRYIVFLPEADYIGVSKNIADINERERLRNFIETIKPKDVGVIVRTVAEGVGEEELKKDFLYLQSIWNSLKKRIQIANAPCLLYREIDLPLRVMRDYLNEDIDEIIVDNKETANIIKDFIKTGYSNYKGKVTYYENNENIYSYFQIDSNIENISARKVSLKSGGYLVFDHTEALHIIDVNTGSFKGADTLEHTALDTNLEAAEEVARQIRLRDLGGIIIIDFIDMHDPIHKELVIKKLESSVLGDKMKPRVLGITHLGLVEMTRKKTRQNMATTLLVECPVCHGSGKVKSPETISVEIRRKIRTIKNSRPLILQAHPQVAEWFLTYELERVSRDKKVKVQSIENMHPETYTLLFDLE